MFWNKKIKSPITNTDEDWLNNDLTWLREAFNEEHFQSIKTVTPTKDCYNRDFDGTKKDAHYVFERTKELMGIENDSLKLGFYNDSPILSDDGILLSSPSESVFGDWESSSGTYEQKTNDVTIISIEINQLKNPISLIATISHELSHEVLLGEGWIKENDEFLTDLTALFYGFGIFLGNSQFVFSNNESGWESKSQGYLPKQIIAYATAWLSYERKEDMFFVKYFDKSLQKLFNQSLQYIKSKNSN